MCGTGRENIRKMLQNEETEKLKVSLRKWNLVKLVLEKKNQTFKYQENSSKIVEEEPKCSQ